MKKYFDPAIFDFYFFDGEQLRQFFSKEKAEFIRGSIFNIAQVTLLQTVCGHVKKKYDEKIREFGKNNPDISDLIDEQNFVNEQRNLALKSIKTSEDAKNVANEKLNKIENLLGQVMPIKNLQNERKNLEKEQKKCDEEEKGLMSDWSEFISRYTILLKLYPRIKRTLQIIEDKEASGDLPPAIDRDQIKKVLDNLDKPCPLCDNPHIGETGRQHLENLLTQISVSSNTSNYLKEIKGFVESYCEEAGKYNDRKKELQERELDLEAQRSKIDERLKNINASLSNYANPDLSVNVPDLEKKRKELREQISAADKTIGASEENIKLYDKQIESLQKQIDEAQSKLRIRDDLKYEITVLRKLAGYFDEIKDRITTQMRKEIQTTTWNIFDSMIWKRNTFGEIVISNDYEISVYNREGALMTGSLSATEQMALAYSFTLAIHQASGKNCPLVIDSPLGRVSDENRENMARELLKISKDKQIIMLFTPDEYSSSVRQIYDGFVDVRELKLSDDEKYIEGSGIER